MSDIVEKALFSFQSLLSTASSREPTRSRGFQNLIDVVSGSSNKREQDTAIQNELALLKTKLSQPNLKLIHIRDCLIRAIYCEMLGYPAPFIYIHAIKQAQKGSFIDKRVGYLAATLFLHNNDELVILIINTIQKDLTSSNILEICMALTAAVYLVSPEMAPAILNLVEDKLSHPKEMVRKRCILTMHHFLLTCPAAITHLIPRVKACIGDRDPEVVVAVVHFLTSLASIDAASCKDMVTPLVQILNQVLQRKLPADFEYHGLPAPFIQMNILRLLALLGKDDEHCSTLMCDILIRTLEKVDVNHSIGYALIYECVRTAASIQPSEALLDIVCPVIGRFLQSQNNNVKYMGLKALTCIVHKVGKKLASQHQSIIMECLHHPDPTIRTKILDVLFCLANSGNFQVVCPKILDYLSSTTSDYAKTEIVIKLLNLVELYSPNAQWNLETLLTVMMKSSEKVLPKVIQAVQTLLMKESNVSSVDKEFKLFAVKRFLTLIEQSNGSNLPPAIILLAIWVLKEHLNDSEAMPPETIFRVLSLQLEKHIREPHLVANLLMALKQIAINSGCTTDHLPRLLIQCATVRDIAVKQQASELSAILEDLDVVRQLLPESSMRTVPASFDWTLSFLDDFVFKALSADALPYKPFSTRNEAPLSVDIGRAIEHFVPYDVLSTISGTSSKKDVMSVSSISECSERLTSQSQTSTKFSLSENKKVWSKEGYNENKDEISLEMRPTSASSNDSIKLNQNLNRNRDSFVIQEDSELAKALFDDVGNIHATMVNTPVLTGYISDETVFNSSQNLNSSDSSIQQLSSEYGTPTNLVFPMDNSPGYQQNCPVDRRLW